MNQEIEELKRRLINLLKIETLSSNKVLELSNALDKLINAYYRSSQSIVLIKN